MSGNRWVHFSSLGLALATFGVGLASAEEGPAGDAVIRGKAGPSEIVITTTSRLAGAIHSLTWNGREFIDSADHGRQLQSASNFDAGKALHNETYNPTEAGSRRDGAGPTSSSRLLSLHAEGNRLETSTRMAFWLAPGETSGGHPAANTTVLSHHLLEKRVTIGERGLPHAIAYEVAFQVPAGEGHRRAVFEVLTGYMPAEFSVFRTLDPATGTLAPLEDGPGEQPRPVIFSTEDGRHAMGVITGEASPPAGARGPGYGRFRFPVERVTKWNCVYRLSRPEGIEPGVYRFKVHVAVGTLEDVQRTLHALAGRR